MYKIQGNLIERTASSLAASKPLYYYIYIPALMNYSGHVELPLIVRNFNSKACIKIISFSSFNKFCVHYIPKCSQTPRIALFFFLLVVECVIFVNSKKANRYRLKNKINIVSIDFNEAYNLVAKIFRSTFKLIGEGETQYLSDTFPTELEGPAPLFSLAIAKLAHFSLNKLIHRIGFKFCSGTVFQKGTHSVNAILSVWISCTLNFTSAEKDLPSTMFFLKYNEVWMATKVVPLIILEQDVAHTITSSSWCHLYPKQAEQSLK